MPPFPSEKSSSDQQRPTVAKRNHSITSLSSGSTAVSQAPSSAMSSTYHIEPFNSRSSYGSRRHASSPTSASSPVEQSFFSAISQKIRDRSRSRSRSDPRRGRSKSPAPRNQYSPTATEPSTPRASQQRRQLSTSSNGSSHPLPMTKDAKRRSTDSTQASNPWYGRHANSWLFNDFSVTEHVSDAFHKLKRRDT